LWIVFIEELLVTLLAPWIFRRFLVFFGGGGGGGGKFPPLWGGIFKNSKKIIGGFKKNFEKKL